MNDNPTIDDIMFEDEDCFMVLWSDNTITYVDEEEAERLVQEGKWT